MFLILQARARLCIFKSSFREPQSDLLSAKIFVRLIAEKNVNTFDFFFFNISNKLKENPSSSSCLLIPLDQPASSSAQSYLSEVCTRGWSGSGSSPRGAEPELIVSEREQREHVCNPVGLSAVRPGLSSLIDRMEKLQVEPGHNRLKTGNHLQQCLNDKATDL